MARSNRAAWLAVLAVVARAAPALCATAEPVQPAAGFAAAIGNVSASPSYVLVTVVDDTKAATKTGCILSPFLISAIEAQNGLAAGAANDAHARLLALAAPGHVFHFTAAAALDDVNFARLETMNAKACRLLRAGKSAYLSAQTDAVTEGMPGN